jgi:hypothetical protein
MIIVGALIFDTSINKLKKTCEYKCVFIYN